MYNDIDGFVFEIFENILENFEIKGKVLVINIFPQCLLKHSSKSEGSKKLQIYTIIYLSTTPISMQYHP